MLPILLMLRFILTKICKHTFETLFTIRQYLLYGVLLNQKCPRIWIFIEKLRWQTHLAQQTFEYSQNMHRKIKNTCTEYVEAVAKKIHYFYPQLKGLKQPSYPLPFPLRFWVSPFTLALQCLQTFHNECYTRTYFG